MSDIQSFTQSVRDLSRSVDLWNHLMLVGLALTVVAGVFVLVATRMVVFRGSQLATAQESLGAAKDRQLASDLKDKDLKIAAANKATEDERMARVELEDNVSWRILSERHKKDIEADLSRFSGQLAECNFLSSDTEAFSFSSEIAAALRTAHWEVIPPNPYVIALKETTLPTSTSPIEKIGFGVEVLSTSDAQGISAAQAVVKELGKLGFDANFAPSEQRPQASRVWIMVQHRPLGAQGEAKLRGQKATKQ